MIRVRFHTDYSDFRPVKAPAPYPFWCTGYAIDGSNSTVVAYVDDEAQLLEYWPDAVDIDVLEQDAVITFTDRFFKPDWWNPPA